MSAPTAGQRLLAPIEAMMGTIGAMAGAGLLDVADQYLAGEVRAIENLLMTARDLLAELEMGASIEAVP